MSLSVKWVTSKKKNNTYNLAIFDKAFLWNFPDTKKDDSSQVVSNFSTKKKKREREKVKTEEFSQFLNHSVIRDTGALTAW